MDPAELLKSKERKTKLLNKWLRAACVAGKGVESTASQLAIPVQELEEQQVPQVVLEQLQEALLDAKTTHRETGEALEALLQPLLTHLIKTEEQEPPTDGLRT